jgi:glycosyltransferase involved in cell wall biosynthesis
LALHITTDIHGLERVAESGAVIRAYPAALYPSAVERRLRLLFSALRSNHLILHFTLPDVIFFAVLLTILPFHHCRLTTLDFFLAELRGMRLRLARWSLRHVDRFLVYFRDSRVFQHKFGLPPVKFHYIPFKINAFDLIRETTISDQGYIFCGGRSRRDFVALFAAVEPLGYPVKVVTSTEAEMAPHGSSLAGLRVPPNVEVMTNDACAEFFVSSIAAARLVVIPIVAGSTRQAGIGVYLQAMALGKCVIISTSLGVSDVLTGEEALIVPAGDVQALRTAIQRAWQDDALRERVGRAGQRYAIPLGGEDELRRSILAALP